MNRQKSLPVRQAGQVVLILVLVMTVALAIGISVVQRSLSDISTSSKVEQSSRAFSAAEAGIEKALNGDSSGIAAGTFDNQATATVTGNDLIPSIPPTGVRQDPLEYPPLAKEETAHVWLADFNTGAEHYKQTSLDIYWGDSDTDKAALELTLIYHDGSKYVSRKWYLDHPIVRTPANNFEQVSCPGNIVKTYLDGTLSKTYQCGKTISSLPSSGLMLIRARLLYNTSSQPFAVQSSVTCPSLPCGDYSIPPQARRLTSTGTAGQTQRKVQLFQVMKVVPPYFDYAIFSAGDINK